MRKTLVLVAIAVLLVAALTPPGGLAAAIVFLLCGLAPSLVVLFRAAGSRLVPLPAPLRLSSPDRAPPRARA